MPIAPDSVSYPALAVIQAFDLPPELHGHVYTTAREMRRQLERSNGGDQYFLLGWTPEWSKALAINMRRSYRHFNWK